MDSNQIIERLYEHDGLRDANFLESIIAPDFIFEWDSSQDKRLMNKNDIIALAHELKNNYHLSKTSILDKIITESKIVVHYLHHVATIENPKELFTIARVIVIWDVENGQIIKGYQISKPA
ncbi:MAG: hypothetical protein R2790_09605 [Flavobacterium haoranii]